MHVTSEDGEFIFKKVPKMVHTIKHAHLFDVELSGPSMEVCGLYFVTDPNKVVEITVKNIDVNCDTGGLMAVCICLNMAFPRNTAGIRFRAGPPLTDRPKSNDGCV
jgi:hypothetical protein